MFWNTAMEREGFSGSVIDHSIAPLIDQIPTINPACHIAVFSVDNRNNSCQFIGNSALGTADTDPRETHPGLESMILQLRSEGACTVTTRTVQVGTDGNAGPVSSSCPASMPVDFFRLPIDAECDCVVVVTYPTADALEARPSTISALRTIAPRLGFVTQMQFQRMWMVQSHLELILKALSEPAFLCDEALTIVNANPPARRYYEQRFGHELEPGDRRSLLALGDGVLKSGLAGLQKDRQQTASVSFIDEDGTFVLADLIRHLPPGLADIADHVASLKQDPAPLLVVKLKVTRRVVAHVPDEAVRAFGISPAEARLLEGLLMGRTMHEIADAATISYNTVRNQFASIVQKTGLRTQADVIRFFTYLS